MSYLSNKNPDLDLEFPLLQLSKVTNHTILQSIIYLETDFIMGNKENKGRSRKRRFNGNQFSNSKRCKPVEITETPINDSQQCDNISASAKKLSATQAPEKNPDSSPNNCWYY